MSTFIGVFDARYIHLSDALIGSIKALLANGPVHFNLFPNFLVSLTNPFNLSSLGIKLKTKSLEMMNQTDYFKLISIL